MALIQRLGLPKDHTIEEFRMAARLHFREASRLAVAGDRLAAIYLGGYAAEMLLKAAYFRLAGKGPAAPISTQEMYNARSYAKATLGVAWADKLHDLTGWTALLVEERRLRGAPYSWTLARDLLAHTQRIYLNWREYLRYRPNRPYQGETAAVLQGVQWLLGQYRFL
jgi:hypothetical protein